MTAKNRKIRNRPENRRQNLDASFLLDDDRANVRTLADAWSVRPSRTKDRAGVFTVDYLTRTPEGGADLEAARRRLGGDTQLLRDLAQFYVEDAATLLNEAARGIDLGDSELAARAAHSLKGQSANFSARCASAAQEVEDVLRQGDFAEGRRRLEQLRHEVDALIAVLQRDVLADRGKPDA